MSAADPAAYRDRPTPDRAARSSLVEPPPADTRKFLQFYLGRQDCALVAVEAVAEIATVRLSEVLPVPQMRSCISGVYNWRGEMLWIVDLGELLGYAPLFQSSGDANVVGGDRAIAIVIEWDDHTIGFVVPQVLDLQFYNLTHLQRADAQLFPPAVLPYLQGYFIEDSGDIAIVLDLAEIFRMLQHPLP